MIFTGKRSILALSLEKDLRHEWKKAQADSWVAQIYQLTMKVHLSSLLVSPVLRSPSFSIIQLLKASKKKLARWQNMISFLHQWTICLLKCQLKPLFTSEANYFHLWRPSSIVNLKKNLSIKPTYQLRFTMQSFAHMDSSHRGFNTSKSWEV